MPQNSLNFCAQLKINPNLYEKIPAKASKGYPQTLINDYKKFLDLPKIQEMTQGDTIELSRVRYGARGYGLKVDFICGSDESKTILDAGVYNSKNEANISAGSLIFQTIQFLSVKFDVDFRRSSKPINQLIKIIEKFDSLNL